MEQLQARRAFHNKKFGVLQQAVSSSIESLQAPQSTSMRDKIRSVYDQGQCSSCTANAIAQAYRMISPDKAFEPSRLYIYYKERLIESGSQNMTDSGADAQDGLTWIKEKGVASEAVWPYDLSNIEISPPASADVNAESHKLSTIVSLNSNTTSTNLLTSLKSTLLASHPVLIGVELYTSFMSDTVAATGIIPMPNASEELIGGHELLIIGFDDTKEQFQVVNSWGNMWGDSGFCYFPYSYITNSQLTAEFRYFTI